MDIKVKNDSITNNPLSNIGNALRRKAKEVLNTEEKTKRLSALHLNNQHLKALSSK